MEVLTNNHESECLTDRAVVVVNYGSHTLIAKNLTQETVEGASSRVVVVDNFSSAEEREAVSALCSRRNWRLVGSAQNRGFGAGVNLGVGAAAAEGARYFVVLNPDAVVTAAALSGLFHRVTEAPMRVIAPVIRDSSGAIVFEGSQVSTRTGAMRRSWQPGDDDPAWANWLSGACLAFSGDAFQAAGGFAEDYFLYWEDVDFSRRVAAAGLDLDVARDIEVVHDEGGTQRAPSSRSKSNTYYFYNTRNRLLFARHHLPGSRWQYALATHRESAQIWLRGGRRQVLSQPRGLVSAVAGSVAGLGWLWRREPRRGGSRSSGTVIVAHPSPDLYGSDRVLLETVSAMVEGGRRVVAVLPAIGPLVQPLLDRGATVEICPAPVLRKSALSLRGMGGLLWQTLTVLPRACRLIRAQRADLVLVNTITNFVWLGAGRLVGVRVVCHVHEAERSAPGLVRKGLYAPLLLADELLVNSQYAWGVLKDTWAPLADRATLVRNGVVGPDDPTPPRSVLDEEVQLVFIGRLSPRKGPQVAVEALAILRSRGHAVHLRLLGAIFEGYDWFEAELRASVERLGLGEHVTFLGFDPDVFGHLGRADIVLVPSTVDEPFGNTAVEAMLAQRPLVVSATSGLLEAASGYSTARPVAPADPVALADAVEGLIADWPAVAQKVSEDREQALRRHAPERYRARVRDILSSPTPTQENRSTHDTRR